MEFIEFALFWEGGLNRSDLIEQFGISTPQASNDLSYYRSIAEKNIMYDAQEKKYLATKSFKPLFLKPDPNKYLSHLKLLADKTLEHGETWISFLPDSDTLPVPQRYVESSCLREILQAVKYRQKINVYYQSMNKDRPEPIWRIISPHAFANDGMRWHVRAYCHIENKFKDFILSRFIKIKIGEASDINSESDVSWHELLDVVLMANPKLSNAQQEVVAFDYGLKNKELTIKVRKAMLFYFKKRLRLDLTDILKNPKEVPLIVKNTDALDKAIQES